MSNPQTAADWKKVADEQLAIAKQVGEEEKVIGRQLADVFSEKEKIDRQIRSDATTLRVLGAAVARGEKLETEAQKRYDLALSRNEADKAKAAELDAKRVSLQSQAAPFTEQRTNAERAAQEAFQKSKEAETADPNANSVPAPAGDSTNANSTGSPTAVQPNPPTIESANAQKTEVVVGGPITPPTGTVRDISPTGEFGPEQPLAGPAQEQQTVSEPGFGEATQAEADAINIAQQKQVEETLGATQTEADFINAEAERQAQQSREAANELTREGRRGLPGKVKDTQAQASVQDTVNFNQLPDWRVRLSLAPNANYLYATDSAILKPLQATNGVIFPYTPSIQLGYTANYDALDVTHSNYKLYQYKNSAVEQISITADFTAQDTNEAVYVLAVIHFFRTITKMFYGKDQNPIAGTPPPLCYLYGLGDFQFNQHPVVISNFSYTLPTDVDYIRAGAPTLVAGQSSSGYNTPNNSKNASTSRMQGSNVPPGGNYAPPKWTTSTNVEPTYIPTKLQMSITALPIVTRKDISDNFSVKEYATGNLMKGKQNARGGIW
jgi:hypothetical protein